MPHRRFTRLCVLASCIACVFAPTPASAEVAVFSNRTLQRLTVSVLPDSVVPQPFTLEVGESRPVFYERALSVRFGEGLVQQTFQVAAKSAYFFTRGQGDEPLRIEQIGFGHNKPAPSEPTPPGRRSTTPVIAVKLLVDDDEPTHRPIWEANLRRRFAAAAEIIERHSGVKLSIAAIGSWDSDDRQFDFTSSLSEFEREVAPQPAQLAIGFTSQYNVQSGRIHMGGTRGALHPYILLKERSPSMLETQRIELLVHELGHFLGASHSPEPQSVMRPLLTSDIQRRAGSKIGFDPVNTLLMAMVGDEIRTRGVKRLDQLSRPTRTRMEEIYGVLVKALPADPAAEQYLQMLAMTAVQQAGQPAAQPAAHTPALPVPTASDAQARATTRALYQLLQVVKARRPESIGDSQSATASQWYTGDKLTEFYVRQAALAVVQQEPDEMEKVFLLALGLFFDDTGLLRQFPATAGFASRVEGEAQREARLRILGTPTMRDRHDLAQHFFMSAHLSALLGPQVALGLGVAKEMQDANGGSGFSFADLAADRAGIEFATRVAAGKISLEDLSEDFSVESYLPSLDGLAEGLQLAEFKQRFGDIPDKRFQDEVARIDAAILALPAYQK